MMNSADEKKLSMEACEYIHVHIFSVGWQQSERLDSSEWVNKWLDK